MEGSLWLHLFDRLCCIHIIKAVLVWASSQGGKRVALQGPGTLVAFIKTGCCQASWVMNWNRKQLTFCSDLSREAACVNMEGLKKIFISDEVMHQSFQGRLWCPEAQENTCVKIRSEIHVDFFFSFDINCLVHVKLISQGLSIIYG